MDALNEDYIGPEAQVSAPAKRQRAPRNPVAYDHAAGTVTTRSVTYALDAIPADLHRQLALRGLALMLHQARNPQRLYDALRVGRMRIREPGKPREVSPWRRAIAAAIVEESKKAGTPIAAEDALARAAAFPKDKLRRVKTTPAVVKHYARITGASVSLLD